MGLACLMRATPDEGVGVGVGVGVDVGGGSMQLEQGSRPKAGRSTFPRRGTGRRDGTRWQSGGSHRYWRGHHRAILAETGTSGDNKVVKAAAATFVGVPAGLYGEVKQIIVGRPADERY